MSSVPDIGFSCILSYSFELFCSFFLVPRRIYATMAVKLVYAVPAYHTMFEESHIYATMAVRLV